MALVALVVLALYACIAHAGTFVGSSPGLARAIGLRQANPTDTCTPINGIHGVPLVQPQIAEFTFHGTAVTVRGSGGIAQFSLDGNQNITSTDTGAQQCMQVAQYTGLDPGVSHVLLIEALESSRAFIIGDVAIDDGTGSTTVVSPSGTTVLPGSTTTSSGTAPTGAPGSTPAGSVLPQATLGQGLDAAALCVLLSVLFTVL